MDNLKRKSLRLPGFDYCQPGAYYLTLCSYNKQCIFGRIVDFEMEVSRFGSIIASCWEDMVQTHRVSLDHWVLMPNHLHAIVWLNDDNDRSLSAIVAAFKARSTSKIRATNATKVILWQRGFFEHIIRNQSDLLRVRQYIVDNPINWSLDELNCDSNPEIHCAGGIVRGDIVV